MSFFINSAHHTLAKYGGSTTFPDGEKGAVSINMDIQLTWQDQQRGLHRAYIGELSMSDVLESTLALQEHKQFQTLQYIIEDYTQATNPPFKPEQTDTFSSIVRMRANTKPHLKVAIVSRNTSESIAIAQRFCKQMEDCHYQCEVFCLLVEAQAWATSS